MKSRLLVLCLTIYTLSATAQEERNDYNVSAFSSYRLLAQQSQVRSNSVAKVQDYLPDMMVKVDPISGLFTDIFGSAVPMQGNTLEEKVEHCFQDFLVDFELVAGEWTKVRNHQAGHATFLTYEQSIQGRKVIFSKLNFRFTQGGRLERLQMKSYGRLTEGASSIEHSSGILEGVVQSLTGFQITEQEIDDNWVWFPVPSSMGYHLRPAYPFRVQGRGKVLPVDLHGYVDAVTGVVLYQSNAVMQTVDLTVKGSVYTQNPTVAASIEPLKNLLITVNGGNFYTDTAGYFTESSLTTPIAATINLEGKWAKVRAVASGNITPSHQEQILNIGGTSIFPVLSPSSDRHVNAYYHVNKIHDFMKGFFPAFTLLDNQMQTNIDVTGTCNAFYNGSSINFFPEGGGCNASSLCPDVIYHEYGHAISNRFYTWHGVGPMVNGALNEGSSDIWAISLTGDPHYGRGFYIGGGSQRQYDLAPKVYPQDITGEVHDDGEIIAGAWWDVAVNINSVDTMSQLFAATFYDLPDGPNGTEGDVYHQVLVSALLNDDDDNILVNGTPHFIPIVTAFAKHGIHLLGDASLNHVEVPNQPENAPITIGVNLNVSVPNYLQGVKLFYRNRTGVWDSLDMIDNGGLSYSGQIPGQPAGSLVDYYFAIYDTFSHKNATFPEGFRPEGYPADHTIPYQFGVGVNSTLNIDFEGSLPGWTVGNFVGDNATGGIWVQEAPVGSYVNTVIGSLPVQPGSDHTTGTTGKCLVTGNASSTTSPIGDADVDAPSSNSIGRTTVVTPVFDISNYVEPIIEYFRWYTNSRGTSPNQDFWKVMIKDSAAPYWSKYVERTKKSDHNWRRRIFNVREFLPGSSKVMLKFIGEDEGGSSIVEAAVDDFALYDKAFPSDVEVIAALNASIYPNPADQQIHVRTGSGFEGVIVLSDITGKELMRLNSNGGNEYAFGTRGVAAGVYNVVIRGAKAVVSKRVVIKH